MIHTVKDFSIVNEAEVVFLELPCFVHDPTYVGSLLSLKPSLYFAVWQEVSVGCSVISDSANPWTGTCRQESWTLGGLSSPGIKPASLVSSVLTVRFFTPSASGHVVSQLCFVFCFFFLKDGSMAK